MPARQARARHCTVLLSLDILPSRATVEVRRLMLLQGVNKKFYKKEREKNPAKTLDKFIFAKNQSRIKKNIQFRQIFYIVMGLYLLLTI